MNGGGLNYIHARLQPWGGSCRQELFEAQDRLERLKHTEAANRVKEARDHLEALDAFLEEFEGPLQALDLYIAGDFSEDYVLKAVAKWRTETGR